MFSNIQKCRLQNCLPWSWMSQGDLYNSSKSLLAGAEKEIKKGALPLNCYCRSPRKMSHMKAVQLLVHNLTQFFTKLFPPYQLISSYFPLFSWLLCYSHLRNPFPMSCSVITTFCETPELVCFSSCAEEHKD